MRIVTARRISQVFFLLLFLWLCVVTTAGVQWWQLRGWPKNWLLQLDPLVALATLLATGAVFAGLLWALLSVVLTVLLGRFFCGWVCPFGTIHQAVGALGKRGRKLKDRIGVNRYRPSQAIKYYILLFVLAAASGSLLARALKAPRQHPVEFLVAAGAAAIALVTARKALRTAKGVAAVVAVAAAWTAAGLLLRTDALLAASLQSGLLDPLPLVYRSVNLALLPLADSTVEAISPIGRSYELAWLIGGLFLAAVAANLWIPRFYCRYLCPLGALFGVLGRWSIWRIGKKDAQCPGCRLCQRHCEGACEPGETIRISECVLCMNCLDDCHQHLPGYRTRPSSAGEITGPDISRRGVLLSLVGGLAAVPLIRLAGRLGANWDPQVIRPPGALAEAEFLDRCIKCGQCMRVCPTNVLQPAGMQAGLEGLWTPLLNNRIGSSGCQLNCVACGQVCPTGAIRPIRPEEKLGRGAYAANGPIRLGLAFVDRSRCLPWVLDKPCIVCQENCPVSPKAIHLEQKFLTVAQGAVKAAEGATFQADKPFGAAAYGSGDHYCRLAGDSRDERYLIVRNSQDSITLSVGEGWEAPAPGARFQIQLRLQLPHVAPKECTGCGICEHECPVSGLRAIRVTAENESRSPSRAMLL